ncbi:uncharacterized protein V6R79_005214 [Siganus canaliculatus]
MKKGTETILLLFLLVFVLNAKCTRYSPPGKPTLTRCRSPEKETFTCWWEPGSDGGLPTTYALYYRKENSDTVYECPDYDTAGANSCFFNKNDTSIWVNYNITVMATNALGSTFSDPVDIDVMYIVKPNPPESVTVTVMEDKGWPFLRVSWEPPHKADTRSGWITLIYEIRVKLEEENEWEMHRAGQQKTFNIYSLRSGGTYLIQVRCKPDHGFWSEWSSASYIRVPDYFHREKSVWILIIVFSAFIFLIFTWLLHVTSHSLKHYILPPVPGPKIRGFDEQLFKNGKSEEAFSALVVPDFPPTSSSNYEDLMVEYLQVYIPEEQELMLEECKDLQDGCLKYEGSTSDCDSGRGSCDSHTLLMDKSGEAKEEERQINQEGMGRTKGQKHQRDWKEKAVASSHEDMVSPDMLSGRVKTWPSVFSASPQHNSNLLNQQISLEMTKHHYLSDSLLPPGSMSSYLTQPGYNAKEALGPNYWEFGLSSQQPGLLHVQGRQQLQAHSAINISTIGHKQEPVGLHLPSHKTTVNLKAEKFNSDHENVKGCYQTVHGEEYSRVKGVDRDNLLLLQRELMEEGRFPCDHQEMNVVRENCDMQKPSGCIQSMPNQDEKVLAVNGYVDTATMCTMHVGAL